MGSRAWPISFHTRRRDKDTNGLLSTVKVRQQYALSKPLYARRAELLTKIPNFWPLVLEQAPMDIDEYIQPSDSAILLS